MNIKGASGQYCFVSTKRLNVPLALMSKSTKGSLLAQS